MRAFWRPRACRAGGMARPAWRAGPDRTAYGAGARCLLARGTVDDYVGGHPGPADVALVVEVADTTLAKDRRRKRTYGPAGIPVYWIVNLRDRKVEVYTSPGPDGYASRTDYSPAMNVPLVINGATVGEIAVTDILS